MNTDFFPDAGFLAVNMMMNTQYGPDTPGIGKVETVHRMKPVRSPDKDFQICVQVGALLTKIPLDLGRGLSAIIVSGLFCQRGFLSTMGNPLLVKSRALCNSITAVGRVGLEFCDYR